jgi:glutamine amidotransferase
MKPDLKENILATSSYGLTFASAARSGNVYGTQFHPEKSHHWGVQLLKNFAERT